MARVKVAIGAARAVKDIHHGGLKGNLREIVIRDLFRPLLPADVGVGTGKIISAKNQYSKQQDIVIYDKRILPPVAFEEHTGMFPVESVLYAIEVKSKLTASGVRASHQSAIELMGFNYMAGEFDQSDKPIEHNITKLLSAILAFDTNLAEKGKSEIQRYDEIRGSEFPAIRSICIVGRGHWEISKNGEWRMFPQKYPLAEVVSFIAVVMNTYRRVAATRKEPRLGLHLI